MDEAYIMMSETITSSYSKEYVEIFILTLFNSFSRVLNNAISLLQD